MAQTFGNIGSVQAAASQGAALPSTAVSNGTGNFQKDAAEPSTAAQFGDVLKKIQTQYGAKAEKPREIKKTLGKDDFLRIMITQMQHQDPTNPFKAEQMAAEMAQFTSVEQLQNMNQNLGKFMQKDQPMERLAMTNLIGKTITVDRDRFPHADGSGESLNYALPRDAAEVKIALISETGDVVLEKDLGPQKAGEQTFAWDGLKGNHLPAKAGNYMFRIEAKDDRGQTLQTDSQKKARVVGVSFEGSEPVFLVGDAKHQDKITMKNIVRIDEDFDGASSGLPQQAGSGSVPGGGAAISAPKAPNFIAFQKGVGSSNLDPNQVSPDAAQALSKYQGSGGADAEPAAKNPSSPLKGGVSAQAPARAAAAPARAPVAEEKGFPNGLHD